jgi:PEP-CTERM motif
MKTRTVFHAVCRPVRAIVGKTTCLRLLSLALGMLAPQLAFANTLTVNAPVDVVGNLPSADFIGNAYGTQSYKDWGNEPFVAVNPLNTNQVVVSSFAFGSSSTSSGASIFYSTTGGSSWATEFSVPAPASGIGIPNDWNFAYDSGGLLHGAVLGGCNATCNVYQGTSTDPTSIAAWSWTAGGAQINSAGSTNNADQPWIAVSGGKVFVAYDDFSKNTGERVAVSNNNGTTFTVDNPINNGPQSSNAAFNPGTRIATDGAGNVYSIFGVGTATGTSGVLNMTYYLNRSRDGGMTWDFNGSSVVGGITIATGVSTQLDNAGTQASNHWFANVNDLRGNVTAIAADATGAHIYVLFGKQDGSGNNQIYLQEFHPSGTNLVGSTPIVVSPSGQQSALPSLTVLADGTVVMMFDSFDGTMVHVHVVSSSDFGASIGSDVVEQSFTPLALSAIGASNREFGDYAYIMSNGNSFFGTFAGVGDVNAGGINTTGLIDPYFFSGSVPEPNTLLLLGTGLVSILGVQRRRVRGGRNLTQACG